jgi:hypothetical protein
MFGGFFFFWGDSNLVRKELPAMTLVGLFPWPNRNLHASPRQPDACDLYATLAARSLSLISDPRQHDAFRFNDRL